WVLGAVNWTPALIRRAVIWLSRKVGKALLKLDDDDFREHELYELLREHGPAHRLGRRVFDEMMATICTDPGRVSRFEDRGSRIEDRELKGEAGEQAPGSPSSTLDPRSSILDPRSSILVFSPHPDDDVISMGGTLIRLVEQGHKVHVAYMTSGNI